ncbi:hypothetical protein [Chitinophaga sp. Cy-1792]|uniref:hypothetical protein n=1 Tax=Chitinophaga sp. Cy-1792 TaxID=2608339 RepID=UPI001422408D|nr:hypothetical protein [Chitinophaga sp. Cy-1792]NIG52846.1 hypothetical protein [Chitinophaga sp. Cy-1792]
MFSQSFSTVLLLYFKFITILPVMPLNSFMEEPVNQRISNKETQKICNKLKLLGYKFPEPAAFERIVQELAGISLADSKYNDIRLMHTKEPGKSDIWAVRSARILIPDEDLENFCDTYDEHHQVIDIPISQWSERFFHYLLAFNRFLVYNDTSLFPMVKYHYGAALQNIFFDLGYSISQPLNKWMIAGISEDAEGRADFIRTIYGWNQQAGKLMLRENRLLLIQELKPALFVHTVSTIQYLRMMKVAPLEIGKLINAAIVAGFTDFVEDVCEEDQPLIQELVKADFKTCPLLKSLIDETDYSFRR